MDTGPLANLSLYGQQNPLSVAPVQQKQPQQQPQQEYDAGAVLSRYQQALDDLDKPKNNGLTKEQKNQEMMKFGLALLQASGNPKGNFSDSIGKAGLATLASRDALKKANARQSELKRDARSGILSNMENLKRDTRDYKVGRKDKAYTRTQDKEKTIYDKKQDEQQLALDRRELDIAEIRAQGGNVSQTTNVNRISTIEKMARKEAGEKFDISYHEKGDLFGVVGWDREDPGKAAKASAFVDKYLRQAYAQDSNGQRVTLPDFGSEAKPGSLEQLRDAQNGGQGTQGALPPYAGSVPYRPSTDPFELR